MARFVIRYRCPECGESFSYPADTPQDAPDRCQVCHAWMSDEEPTEFVPKAPAIRKSPYVKAVDQIYRQTESQSIDRANEAASLLDDEYRRQPKDEYSDSPLMAEMQKSQLDDMKSGLKITNMREPTEMREGDTAAIMPKTSPNSPVAQGAGFQNFNGPVSGAPGSGDMVNFVKSFTAEHTPRAVGMIREGNMGRYRG
jgi:hypothetical protein